MKILTEEEQLIKHRDLLYSKIKNLERLSYENLSLKEKLSKKLIKNHKKINKLSNTIEILQSSIDLMWEYCDIIREKININQEKDETTKEEKNGN